jgi:hypothetical protein
MVVYTEKIDMRKMKIILSNFDHLWEKGQIKVKDEEYNQIEDKEQARTILTHFYNAHDHNGLYKATYKPSKNNPDGRLFAPFSLQGISRNIRHTVAEEYLIDIDIKNCHPTILQNILERNSMKCDHIKEYNKNRNAVLDKLVEEKTCDDRDSAKRLILSIINGCGRDEMWGEWLQGLYDEIQFLLKRIQRVFPDMYQRAVKAKKSNKSGSALNYELCRNERLQLDKIREFCRKRKYQIATLCHDGLMLYYDEEEDYEAICREISEEIGMEVLVKLMEEQIDLTGLEAKEVAEKPLPEDPIEEVVEKAPTGFPFYMDKKREWEKKWHKLLNPYCFMEEIDGELYPKKHREMEDCYVNEYFEDDDGNKAPFIYVWMRDTRIRTYHREVFDPSNKQPRSVYNRFRGLAIHQLDDSNYDKEIGQKGLEVYLRHLFYLSGQDKNVSTYIQKWKAHTIQKPDEKTRTCLVFKGDQGVMKSADSEYWGRHVIGKKMYVNSEKPKDFVGNFNDDRENKLFVALDDSNVAETMVAQDEIKTLIDKDSCTIRAKHKKNKQDIQEFINLIYCTNNNVPVNIPPDDRRYMVIACSKKYADVNPRTTQEERDAYREEFFSYFNHRNPCLHTLIAIRDYFMAIDISDFKPQRDRVITDAYRDMKTASMPTILKFYYDYSENEIANNTPEIYTRRKALYGRYRKWMDECNPGGKVMGSTTFYGSSKPYFMGNDGFITEKYNKGRYYYRWNTQQVIDYLRERDMITEPVEEERPQKLQFL